MAGKPGAYFRVRGTRQEGGTSEWRQVKGMPAAVKQAEWLLGMGYDEATIERVHITYRYEIVKTLTNED